METLTNGDYKRASEALQHIMDKFEDDETLAALNGEDKEIWQRTTDKFKRYITRIS